MCAHALVYDFISLVKLKWGDALASYLQLNLQLIEMHINK